MRELFRRLRGQYGDVKPPVPLPVCEQLLLRILADEGDYTRALEALDRLRKNFVDWNELRVSFGDEIDEVLEGLGFEESKAPELKRLLEDIFNQFDSFNLEFLKGESTEDAFEALSSMPSVKERALADAMVVSFGAKELPRTPDVARVLRRVGVLPKGVEAGTLTSALKTQTAGQYTYALFYYLTRLGNEICRAEEVKCEGCPLLEVCEYGGLSCGVSKQGRRTTKVRRRRR